MALPEVHIELYENGKGPRHTFKTKLQGWEANRLDLETIQNTYRLNAVYAFSLSTGRGQRLVYHPRNGLSVVCYSGKPGAIIRLDSDPKTPLKTQLLRMAVVGMVVGMLLWTIFHDVHPEWYYKWKEIGGAGVGWILAFVVLIATQVTGWPFRRNLRNIRNMRRRVA